jgi:peptidyl-tRNA hydrolase
MRGKDYVLGRFTTEQRKLLEPAIDRATGAILTWIDKGIESAMSQFNAEEKE